MDNTNSGDLVDLIRVEGVNAKGYGTIPKAVMMDRRLTICAKAIYSYFCSFCGAGSRAFPSFHKIIKDLQISKSYYYDNMKLLKKYDYLRIEQQRTGGQFKRNIYTLTPFPTSQETVDTPLPTSRDTVTQEHNNNKNNINSNKNLSYLSKKDTKVKPNMMDRIDNYTSLIKENIEYDLFVTDGSQKFMDSIVLLIVDTLLSEAPTFRIGGADIDAQTVKTRLLALDQSDISCVLNSVDLNAGRVRNPKNYLLTVLFNAPATSELFWKTEINNLMREYHASGRTHRDYCQEIEELEDTEWNTE